MTTSRTSGNPQRTRNRLGLLIASLFAAEAVWAHPGHAGIDDFSVSHFLSDPLHLSSLALCAGALALYRRHRRLRARA